MEVIIEKIEIDENGRIIVSFNDGFSWEFSSIAAALDYTKVVLDNDAIKRIVIATLLVNNQLKATNIPKKYVLSMIGEPILRIQDV